ncbi:putative GAF sensor protein [Cylindrospermum sp. NIES-4074]|nr:putative GAF sensor protein [Cylindrospermum sp. NIES-4074]
MLFWASYILLQAMLTDNQMGQPQKPIAAEQPILSLGRVLQNLREEDNVDVLIATTITYLQEQFNYQLIWIALYDRLNHVLIGKGGSTADHQISFLHKPVGLNPGDLLEQVVIAQCPLGVADLQREPRAAQWHEVAAKYEIQGTIILPIRHRDSCMGVVLLGSQRWGYLLAGEAKARLQMVLGQLGTVLHHHEMNLQQKQTKRPDEPLLRLLEKVRTLSNLDQRLEAVVQSTHQFVFPHRTNIYWFEPQGHYFWCRMSNQLVNMARNASSQKAAAGMTVQDLNDFYYALSDNQIVSIGEARSSLKSNFTGKLLQRLQVRSLLAAPILWQKDLLGFLAVEGLEPRIWTEAERHFVQGAAGLISLIAPTDNMESTIRKIQQDSQLTSQVAQAIYNEQDFHETLRLCATRVLERLTATRFLLLQYDYDQNNYQVLYQISPHNRRPWTFALNALPDVDRQFLQKTTQAVEIENFDEDLRLANWRPPLLENSVRSLLICNCTQGHTPEALLVITHETHRSWTTPEKELLWVVSQQIGVIVRQWQLRASSKEQQKISRIFTQCLRILVQVQSEATEAEIKHLERAALEQIASILDCPLAVLLSWSPGQSRAEIIPGAITNNQFGIVADVPVSVQGEALIQWTLSQDSYLCLKANDLPPETRKWLNVPDSSQVFVVALRTPAIYQPTGVVLLADYQEQTWSEASLNATVTLVSQLAWWRRQQQISQFLESITEELRQLNWYKNRRLEEIHRTAALLLGQIHDLGIPANELTQTRYRLLLRQLDHATASITGILKLEQWQLHMSWETMPITSLLKRSLERIDNTLKKHKLWIGVHGLGQPNEEHESPQTPSFLKGMITTGNLSAMAIAGDIVKIELVLHELLVTACRRSEDGSRIDIWCRRLDERFLELSITDNGAIEPQLLIDLHHDTPKDLLTLSHLNQPPGLHLLICQKLMQQLGGELHFYQLPDQRVVSSLLLLIAPTGK